MANNLKQKINTLWLVLSPAHFGPLPLMIVMSLYAFTMLMIADIVSAGHNGSEQLSKQWWIIVIICGLLVEVLNQITYLLAKTKNKVAIILKAVIFWCIFTGGVGVYIYLLGSLDKNLIWNWREEIIYIFIYIVLAWVFPMYSLSPDIRFLFVSGKFQKR